MSTFEPHFPNKYSDNSDSTSDNLHHFSDFTPRRDRPHSIDMSLELEQQLESELASPTSSLSKERHLSLDPNVLQGLVQNLRQALLEVTREKEDQAEQIAEHVSREADLKDRYDMLVEECEGQKLEIETLRKRTQDDEEAISMLRTKLEESRRALMRLQTENRRANQMGSDGGRSPSLFMTGSPTSKKDKRASFTPLTGSGIRVNTHRRIASLTGAPTFLPEGDSLDSNLASPNTQTNFADDAISNSSKVSSRQSGVFLQNAAGSTDHNDALLAQIEMLKQELSTTKSELEEATKEMLEARDAQEASDLCASALRQFIAEHSVGETKDEVSTPVVKVVATPAKLSETETRRTSGWGLRLWRVDTKDSTPRQSEAEHLYSPSSELTPQTPNAAKKFGGLFSSRASLSSTTSVPSLQDPLLSGSDTSSSDSESISPQTVFSICSFDGSDVSPVGEKVDLDATFNKNAIYLVEEAHEAPIVL